MLLVCGTILAVTFVILLSLPNSKLRDFMLPIASWCVAIFCGIYCISPIDIIPEALTGPFGLIDDIGALVAGIAAARTAIATRKSG
jgi:uncharacterized membrane protein YkvA (DUF1232 family)